MRLRDELGPTLRLAVPLILMQLLSFAQPVVDTVMAGRHSDLTLASVALAAQILPVHGGLRAGDDRRHLAGQRPR